MHIQSYEEIGKRRFKEITAGLLLIMIFLSYGIGHASAKGVVQTIDTGFYDADQMKQPKNIVGENRWSNGTYSDSLVNKNNVKFSIKDKLAIEATLTISPTSGTWIYYPANISGNLISYTNARGRIAYEDLDTTLKETIILNAPVSSITWILNLSVKPQSLGFSVDADGYSIRDPANTDQRIHIPFPYVTDALGVKRTLSYSWNNGQKRITLNQDFAGLVYPLTIDPVYSVDTTGSVGSFANLLINQTHVQIIYYDDTNLKIKLAVNNTAGFSISNIINVGSTSYALGATIDPSNDMPAVFSSGLSSKASNFSWYRNHWFSCETYWAIPSFTTFYNAYPMSITGNRAFVVFFNETYGNLNLTRYEDISGTSVTNYKHYIVPVIVTSGRFAIDGAKNTSGILNVVWSSNQRLNLTTITNTASPSIVTTLLTTDAAVNATKPRLSLDFNPTTDMPAFAYIPYDASNVGRGINFTYLDKTSSHWYHELAYNNVTVGGMSRIHNLDLAFNSSGYAAIVFIEGASGSSTNTANYIVSYIKRTAVNTWSAPVSLEGGGSSSTGIPSIDFDAADGLHIAWFNDTTDDLKYYFEALPAAAGNAPVAAFSVTPSVPLAIIRNGTVAIIDQSTNAPTSAELYGTGPNPCITGNLSISPGGAQNIFPRHFGYCSLCEIAANAYGTDTECQTNIIYTSQPQTVI